MATGSTMDMTPDGMRLAPGKHQFVLPDGRKLYLRVYDHQKDHTCVDIWTTRDRDDEEISRNTGDTSKAPMGMFAWRNGCRYTLGGAGLPVEGAVEPDPDSHGWPAVSCVSLLWDQNEEGRAR